MGSEQIPRSLAQLAVPIGQLSPYCRNPRRGDLPAVTESLKAHGQYRAIVVNRHTCSRCGKGGHVLAGNHTWRAARELGWAKIAVTWVDVDDDEAARIVAIDNRTADLGTYDAAVLTELLAELPGLEGTGYDDDALAKLLVDATVSRETVDPDTAPEPPAEPMTRPGDVWVLGRHRLICGDAEDPDVLHQVIERPPGLIFADPPYGMALDTNFKVVHNYTSGNYRRVIGDDKPFDPTPLLKIFAGVKEQVWWGADYYRQHLLPGGSWVVWDKRWTEQDVDLHKVRGAEFELAWSRTPHRRQIIRLLWMGFYGMRHEREDGQRRIHPTQKPVELSRRFIERTKGPVVDPYLGSGTTLIAAEQLRRVCYGVEIDPAYCDVTVQRWERLTGEHAERRPARRQRAGAAQSRATRGAAAAAPSDAQP